MYEDHVLSLNDVIDLLNHANQNNNGLSLARIGHGELSLAHWLTKPDLAKEYDYYSPYCGVNGPFKDLSKDIIKAMKTTDILGVLSSQDAVEKWIDLTNELLQDYNIRPKYICSAWIHYQMIASDQFWQWLRDKKVILVGRRASEAKSIFERKGVKILDTVVLEGYTQVDSVHNRLFNNNKWDVALLSAGMPATILAPRLAKSTNKITIDFGHAMDLLIDDEDADFDKLVDEWNSNHLY